MGRFLDEEPTKAYKGKFLDDAPSYKGRFLDEEPSASSVLPNKKAPSYGGKEGFKRLLFGGPTGYLSASGSEDVLPFVGQTVGSSVGGYGGSVAGATAGQAARQGIKAIRGTRDSQPRKLFGVGPTAPGILNDLAGEAAGTAALEGVFRGGEKVIKRALPWAANKMMTSLLSPEKAVLEKNPQWGLDVLRNKIHGSFGQMSKKAKNVQNFAEQEVQNIIKNSPKKVSTKNIIKEVSPIIKRKRLVGDSTARGDVKDIIDVARSVTKKGDTISLEQANAMKRAYYGELPKNTFKPDVKLSGATQEAREKITEGLLRELSSAEPSLKPINRSYKTAIEAEKAIRGAEAAQLKWKYLPFFEVLGGAGGLATGNLPLTAAIVGRRMAMSPWATSNAANVIRKFGESTNLPIARKFGTLAVSELARRN